jgi:hypothetical protein
VEAASYRGRPVWFQLVNPWTRAERDQPYVPSARQRASMALMLGILGVLLVGGAVLAKRNLRLGRGDRRGAVRLGSTMFALGMASWLLVAHHVADPIPQLVATVRGAGLSAVLAGVIWLFYLALEPYVRRERPWTIVSWTRLLDGGVRDAVVWRDVLFGAAWGVLLALVGDLLAMVPALLGRPEPMPSGRILDTLLGLRTRLAFVVGMPTDAVLVSLGLLLLFLVLRLALRRDLPAGLGLVLVLSLLSVVGSDDPIWLSLPMSLFASALIVGMLLRFGLVATMAGIWVSDVLSFTPHSLELDSWLGAGTALVVPLVVALGVYAFRRATRRTSPAAPYAPADSSASRSG